MKEKSCELRRTNLLEQNEKLNRKKTISVWSIVILLTLLVLVGNYLGNGKTNAKYASKIDGVPDTARVACFVSDVTPLSANVSVILSPSTTEWVECYSFTVSNEKSLKVSEVAMEYKLKISITGPTGVEYQICSADSNPNACPAKETSSNSLQTEGGVFAAGVPETHSYVIKARWKSGANKSYLNANIPVSVNITTDVVQLD